MLFNEHPNDEWANSAPIEKKIEQAVDRCINNGAIAPHLKEDAAQDLWLLMLEGRWKTLCEKYDPRRAPFDFYLGYRLYSDCLNLSRKKAYASLKSIDNQNLNAYSELLFPLLEELKTQMRDTLCVLKLDSPGYRLLFKIHVAKPLVMSDLMAYAPQVRKSKIKQIHQLFKQPYALRNKDENIQLVLPLLREVENKDWHLVAIRRLISRKLLKIRRHLNQNSSQLFDNEVVNNLLYVVYR